MHDPLLLLGSQLEGRGSFALVRMAPSLCAGLAAGVDSINPKQWVCEDSVLLAPLEGGAWLAAVADAHWGGLSGEVVVRSVVELWHSAPASDPAARLSEVLYALEERLEARGEDESETTVLLAYVCGPLLAWASIGDSVLWVLGEHEVTERNEPTLRFVGRRAIATPPCAGSLELRAGDVVLLATDGILAVTSMLERDEIAKRLREAGTPLEQRVEGLLRHMSHVGKDNLGVVALQL